MKTSSLLVAAFFSVFFYSCTNKDKSSEDKGVKIMAYYYPRWENFNPETLPLDKLTHIIFSFTVVIGNEMKFENDSSGIMLKKLAAQKKNHPHLKVMVACGGWGGSGGFSEMARSAENRLKFVESVAHFIKEYNLDGLDIDWEYPGMPGIGNPFIPEDKENFTSLMHELRDAMDKISKDQVLTFAVAGWEEFFNHVELDKVMQYATYMNVMSYDLAGGHDPFTSHHTNLGWVKMEDIEGTPAATKILEEGDTTKPFSAEKIISYCMQKGVKPGQIIIGAAFYGKGWSGVPPENNGLYQLNRGQWRGSGRYSSIRENFENKNGYVRYWDSIAEAPYLYNAKDSIFISYEDTVSIRLKTKYAATTGLGGIMFWSLGGDTEKDGLVDAIYTEKMRHK
jgi:chitinase